MPVVNKLEVIRIIRILQKSLQFNSLYAKITMLVKNEQKR